MLELELELGLESVSGEKPGQVVHFDYMYIMPSKDGWYHKYKYVLVLKDDYSGLIDLYPAETCDHRVVVAALQHWESIMGPIETLVSDRGSHFKNRVLEAYVKNREVLYNPLRLSRRQSEDASTSSDATPRIVKQSHHFTMAYCPWANGTVENVNRHLKSLLLIMLKEAKLSVEEWPAMLPIVSGILNSTKSYRSHGYSARELYMGHKAANPLDVLYSQKATEIHHLHVPKSHEELSSDFQKLIEGLDKMHKEVDDRRAAIYDRNYWGKQVKSRKENGMSVDVDDRDRLVDFTVGDYVMVAVPGKLPSKLTARWRGPYQVIDTVDPYIYKVRHLVTNEISETHIMRMKFFCNSELNESVSLLDEITSHENYDLLFQPEAIIGCQYDAQLQAAYVKIRWLGFSELEATWEFVDDIARDFPELVDTYFGSLEGMRYNQYNPRSLENNNGGAIE